jgi:hypothetical protein
MKWANIASAVRMLVAPSIKTPNAKEAVCELLWSGSGRCV